ncbi:Eco57I restriction-modification methylase domain-containing protein [Streptomyces sp. fd1-xmd]|uniref:Eco57I restriction-modification methylase domain-containing protein n=1 Tax=Streptomyces sp. fd1-xmd TaxID=1812480 RepID=UPI0009905EAF|nr:DNA methyltransferase [Streptomyces sp. fd1-xmd]AQT71443.1 restriction endonuclease [Streptomyces sp. fd1-xmd]
MSTARTQVTDSVATVGGLLPYDLLVRIKEGKEQTGSKPADYRLYAKGDSVRDAAERSWGYLRGVWAAYQDALARDGADAAPGVHAVGVTTERWLLPLFEQLGFGALTPVPAPGLPSRDGEKDFEVSHHWAHVPVHLTGWNVPLDTRTTELAKQAPQSMVQEYLNRSADSTLWGVLSNGRQLRLLRESASLTGAAFIEFDLRAIFDGDRSDDFVLLWRLLHRTRFEPRAEGEPAATCLLEKWRTEAIDSGTRALKELRKGVEKALTVIGTGLIAHPDNADLRDALRTRDKNVRDDLHPALLRLAYRLLFLFVTEDRDLLLHPDATEKARDTYEKYFSTARLRRVARRTGTLHGDQWQALRLVIEGLGTPGGRPELGLPALGGLFEPTATDAILDGLSLSNQSLYEAVHALCEVYDAKLGRPRKVDYRHLGADELGSVYESLLELEPRLGEGNEYVLAKLDGNDRKTSGSYYTPSPLIDCLLDSTLDPVIDQAVKSGTTKKERKDALLALTVCDPACGSGHFLVAAARRIARRLAEIETDDPEPSAEDVRHALRDVIARCVYGVDLNKMAVELAKVSLWIEAMEPGRPLTFLDAHIKHGNGLLGTTPKLLAEGLPDDAFKPLEGDESKHVTDLKKRNAAERTAWKIALRHGANQDALFAEEEVLAESNSAFGEKVSAITGTDSQELEDVQNQAKAYRELTTSPDYIRAVELADAWCAAFVWRKTKTATPPALTTKSLLTLHSEDGGASLPGGTVEEVARLREEYRFFHWHLEFPEVFRVPANAKASGVDERTGWKGGFSCVLGNPPWETLEFKTEEHFATTAPKIAKAANQAARQALIDKLAESEDEADRELHAEYIAKKRRSDGSSHLARWSGRFPLAARGKLNTYPLFAEAASHGIAPRGRFGLVLQTGIATDATTAPFFSDLVRSKRLVSFLDFKNEAWVLSRDVHHSTRFCLLTVTGREEQVREASFAFGTWYMEDLPARRFTMPLEEILLVNPNTGNLPVFESRRDAEITFGVYNRIPVLLKEPDEYGRGGSNPWGLTFRQGLFNMASDSHLFRGKQELVDEGWQLTGNVFTRIDEEGKTHRYLPLYEAKMLHHFDHRLGTYEGQTQAQANVGTLPRVTPEQHDDPDFAPLPRYWVPEQDVDSGKRDKKGNRIMWAGVETRLAEREWWNGWLMGWRDVARSTDTRTMIGTPLPAFGVGHKFPLMFVEADAAALSGVLGSFAFDYVVRQKVAGTSMTYGYVMQFPVPSPDTQLPFRASEGARLVDWLTSRVLELSYTSRDMASFAKHHGDEGAPFRWDGARRELLRAELDAALFHAYGLSRADVDYVMDTFPTVRKREEALQGAYRTKGLILDIYDRMENARAAGDEYRTVLDPPPGKGPRHEA